MKDLELYYPKPKKLSQEAKYYQKKEQLEEAVSNHPHKENLNICYICLVYFVKQSEIIKSHLSGSQHQKNWKVYQERQKLKT